MPQAPLSSKFYVAFQGPKIEGKLRESVIFGSRLLSTGEDDRTKEAGTGEITETGKSETADTGTGESEAGNKVEEAGEEFGENEDDKDDWDGQEDLNELEEDDEEEDDEEEDDEEEDDEEEDDEEEDYEEEDGVRSLRADRDSYDDMEDEAELWPEAEEILGDFEDLYNPRPLIEKTFNDTGDDEMDFIFEDESLEEEPPFEGATRVLNWEMHMVLQPGEDQEHPLHRKVKMWFDVAEMQMNLGATDACMDRVIALVGPRHTTKHGGEKGRVTLTCEKFNDREDNRREVMQILHDLIDEGMKAGTPEDPLLQLS
ncbi:hypothetical protein CYMTET_12097 [Cymbomonas tetramitiformis]|uniref:Small ribosomal subunit protein mS35 mitochondrial conserved domain-containing protein n=1 Tax=Cymbomonas tetramitiformis TaxID=36881 RepID=A0AAE0GKR8_9CHLO|nr:hypothetical protein CYMTET_12097 [Cymbomonas tetramitiformis]